MLEELVFRGYAPGGGMISPSGVFYLNIPKNASTYLSNVFADNGWEHTNVNDKRITQYIAVLRDPIDRWISGFATYASGWICGAGYGSEHFIADYNDLSERVIFDQLIFDDHTTEQVKFIKQLEGNIPITYFKLGYSMLTDIQYFLDIKLLLNKVNANEGKENYDTKLIGKHIKFRINQDPLLKAKIIKKYEADYELIRTANFYYESR